MEVTISYERVNPNQSPRWVVKIRGAIVAKFDRNIDAIRYVRVNGLFLAEI